MYVTVLKVCLNFYTEDCTITLKATITTAMFTQKLQTGIRQTHVQLLSTLHVALTTQGRSTAGPLNCFYGPQNVYAGPPSLLYIKHWEQKPSGRTDDLPVQSNAEAKNEWSYTSTPPRTCMACKGKLYTLPFSLMFHLSSINLINTRYNNAKMSRIAQSL
jgi:hypothetical protein